MQKLEQFMDETIEKLGFPGIDCIIYQDHKEIFRHASGYSDLEAKTPVKRDAMYNIYSATKIITCVAVLQLLEQGKLLLDDPLAKYLPEFERMQVKKGPHNFCLAKKQIQILDLLTMTAGLDYRADIPAIQSLGQDFTTREFATALTKEPLLFEPGENWHYSFCHDVLGAVIEVISGMTFGEYLKVNIFDPLGMADTDFFVPEEKQHRRAPYYRYDSRSGSVTPVPFTKPRAVFGTRRESGGGGLISTPEDYILFADALACGGVGKNGTRIISPASIRLLSTNRLSGGALSKFQLERGLGLGYGLGVAVFDDPAAAGSLVTKGSFFWGGLAGAQSLIDPEHKISYFVAQHMLNSPKQKLMPHMWNILYSYL